MPGDDSFKIESIHNDFASARSQQLTANSY
jgi:hypothetical protein